ncbi:MAG: helix-turn-helix domain-containing protein [Thermomicrobiales bacterium]
MSADNERQIRRELGRFARGARRALSLSQGDVAHAAGCSTAAISRFESGDALPNTAHLPAIFSAIIAGLEKTGTIAAFVAGCAACGRVVGARDDAVMPRIRASAPAIGMRALGSSAEMLPPLRTGREGADWNAWLHLGQQAAASLDFGRAQRAYRLAIDKARQARHIGGEVLARAELAYVTKELSQPRAAWEATDEVLALLHLTDYPPEGQRMGREFIKRFQDQTALDAYAKVAEIRGHILNNSDQFDRSQATFTTLDAIGQELGSGHMMAEARQFRASQLIELGLQYLDDALTWNTATCPELLDRAIAMLGDARALRANTTLRRGHDWRLEAKAWRILGNRKAARRARDGAEECFAGSLAIGHLRLEQGIAESARGDLKSATEILRETAYLAWELAQPMLLSRALGFLGETLGELGATTPSCIEPALDCSYASLIAWPYHFDCRYFRSVAKLTIALFGLADRPVELAADRADPTKFPFDLVSQTSPYDTQRITTIMTELYKIPR